MRTVRIALAVAAPLVLVAAPAQAATPPPSPAQAATPPPSPGQAATPPPSPGVKQIVVTVVPRALTLSITDRYQSGPPWSAALVVTPTVFGKPFPASSFTLSANHATVTLHPGTLVAKLDPLTFTATGSPPTLAVSGKACHWAFRWKCAAFNKKLMSLA